MVIAAGLFLLLGDISPDTSSWGDSGGSSFDSSSSNDNW